MKKEADFSINLLVKDTEEFVWQKPSQYVEDLLAPLPNVRQHYSYQTAVRPEAYSRSKTPPHARYSLSRPSLDEFFQITSSCHTQHKPSSVIRHNCKFLWINTSQSSSEKRLKLFQRCIHGNDLIFSPFPLKLEHGIGNRVALLDFTILKQLLQPGDAEISQQGTVLRRHNSQMGIIALKSTHQRVRNRIGRVERECGWRIEVLDRSLVSNVNSRSSKTVQDD